MTRKSKITYRELEKAAVAAGPDADTQEIVKHAIAPVLARYFGNNATTDLLELLTEIAENWNRSSQASIHAPSSDDVHVFSAASSSLSRFLKGFAWGAVFIMSGALGLLIGPLGFLFPWLGPGYVAFLIGEAAGKEFFTHTQIYKKCLDIARSVLALEKSKTDYWQRLHWRTLEHEVAQMFRRMGYAAYATSASNDKGVDVVAKRGCEKIIIQCKQYKNRAQRNLVSELLGVQMAESGTRAILICTGGFTKDAEHYANANGIELWDAEDLAQNHHIQCT